MKHPITLGIVLFFSLQLTFAQKVSTDWKDINKTDFIIQHEEYPEAPAVVLFDIGKAYFDVVRNELKLIYERHVRIRINTKDGYEWANINLPYYPYNEYEDFDPIQGYTYNMERGKINKEKLRNRDVFDENIDDRWHQLKFSMPAVKEGSVIEYKYRLVSSDFINFRDWEFQRSIPVLYSEFTTRIPDYFRYVTYYQGAEEMSKNFSKDFRSFFRFEREKDIVNRAKNASRSGVHAVRQSQKTSMQNNFVKYDYNGVESVYAMENIPPLKDVPFVPTLDDYIATIKFQLAEQEIPGYSYESYFTTWENLAKKMLDHPRIGKQLNRNASVKKLTDDIIQGLSGDEEKMIAIYDFVANSIKWDGYYRFAVYDKLSKVFDEKTGNSAEINLILTLMLQEAGLDAHPVLISTRSHGKIIQTYPVIDQFNHLISYTKIGDQVYLMDAIDEELPFDMLPKEDLNGKGFVLIEGQPIWIPLENNSPNSFKTNMIVSFDQDLKLNCSSQSLSTGYYSHSRLDDYESDNESFIKDYYSDKVNEFELDTISVHQQENNNLTELVKFSTNSFVESAADMMYINPMMLYRLEDNKLKRENRKIPVDFNYPWEETYILNLSLPEGYTMIESPKSVKLLLPNQGGEFLYYFSEQAGNIQLISSIKIKKTVYQTEEYQHLKTLFDKIVAKHAQPIVLKKQ